MIAKRMICALTVIAVCSGLSACSIKFGFVDDSSSKPVESSSSKSDNSIISEILDKGYSSTDMGERYTLDGDFSMLELLGLDALTASDWEELSDSDRYDIALNLLNFWAYYGDDASIRYKPSELVSAIGEKLSSSDGEDMSALDAALELSDSENREKYLAVIGVIDIEDAVGDNISDSISE